MKDYEEFYSNGGFGYNKESSHKWIFNKIFSNPPPESETLLDVACGDGFWSFILASRFKVTGIDVSQSGINIARQKAHTETSQSIKFTCGDALELDSSFDIVFCRGPSFLNLPPADPRFIGNITKMYSLCNKELIYIQYTQKPYGRWDKSNLFDKDSDSKTYYNSKWYYHDPEELYKVFSQLGNAEIRDIDSYIVGKIKKI